MIHKIIRAHLNKSSDRKLSHCLSYNRIFLSYLEINRIILFFWLQAFCNCGPGTLSEFKSSFLSFAPDVK